MSIAEEEVASEKALRLAIEADQHSVLSSKRVKEMEDKMEQFEKNKEQLLLEAGDNARFCFSKMLSSEEIITMERHMKHNQKYYNC